MKKSKSSPALGSERHYVGLHSSGSRSKLLHSLKDLPGLPDQLIYETEDRPFVPVVPRTAFDEEAEEAKDKLPVFYIGDEHPERKTPDYLERRALPSAKPQKVKEVPEFSPPDGGYGWVVAIASCVVNIWIVGFIKSFGVLYLPIRSKFPEASAYHSSWLPALLSTIGLLITPITGVLCQKYSARTVSFFGGLLCCLGLVLGSMATSMTQMIVAIGILTGLGAGLTTTPGVLIVSLYFEKRRGIASAICMSGNAVGAFFMPQLMGFLHQNFGLEGSLLIFGALQLNICPASALYRPVQLHALLQARKSQKQKNMEDVEKERYKENFESRSSRVQSIWQKLSGSRVAPTGDSEEESLRHQVSFLRTSSMMNSIPDIQRYGRSWSVSGASDAYDIFSRGAQRRISMRSTGSRAHLNSDSREAYIKPGFGSKLSLQRQKSLEQKEMLLGKHLSHKRSPRMISLIEDAANEDDYEVLNKANGATYNAPNNVNNSNELKPEEKKPPNCCSSCCDITILSCPLFWLMAFSVGCMAVGTPHITFYFPSYANSVNFEPSQVALMLSICSAVDLVGRLSIGAALAGVATFSIPFVTTFATISTLLASYGYGSGGWLVLLPTLLANHHGAKKLSASYGLVRMFQGCINFISPQISGLTLDVTGQYAYLFYFMGSSMATAAVLMILEPFLLKRKNAANFIP